MTPKPITRNTLFYGDNLPILRDHLADESVDLIYLDPPFNSNRSYNVLFKNEKGKESEAQATAFEDTWHWDKAVQTFDDVKRNAPADVEQMLNALATQIQSQLTLRPIVSVVPDGTLPRFELKAQRFFDRRATQGV